MRCLVTGGAGFIGSHLVERLLRDGHAVTVVDNCSTGRWENLQAVSAHPQLKTIEMAVEEMTTDVLGVGDVDWVFHLAALADIVPSIQRPLEYHRANVDGTAVILEMARAGQVKRFVYAASASCYGIPAVYPTPESSPIRPQYPYALTKYLGEQLVLHWGQVYKLPVVSLRLFNAYGPRARATGVYGAVFGVFLAQKLHGQPLTVVGDGTQKRDFVFVTDIVNAFVRAAASEITGEVLNVGNGNPSSINDLAELLKGDVIHIPKRPGEPDCTWADITKINRLLDWQPHTPFVEGVRLMVDRLQEWQAAPVWTPERIAEATREWFACLS